MVIAFGASWAKAGKAMAIQPAAMAAIRPVLMFNAPICAGSSGVPALSPRFDDRRASSRLVSAPRRAGELRKHRCSAKEALLHCRLGEGSVAGAQRFDQAAVLFACAQRLFHIVEPDTQIRLDRDVKGGYLLHQFGPAAQPVDGGVELVVPSYPIAAARYPGVLH